MRNRLLVLAGLLGAAPPVWAQQQHPITFDDFAAVSGVSDPQVSPDGKTVLYAVTTADVGANKRSTTMWRINTGGGGPRRFPDDTTKATETRWSPDGRRVAFIAGGQLWVGGTDGTNRRQLTTLSGDATGPVWSSDGVRIAFTSRVYPSCPDDACNARTSKAADANAVKAHIADRLLYRHWNAWDDGTRAHLFVVASNGGAPVDLIPAAPYDVPPGPFGGSEGYAFSPDGKELAYSAKNQGPADAWSTNVDLYTVPVSSGGTPTDLTRDNHGADQNPVYSPDGRFMAYQSQARAGFEADRWRLMLYDRAAHRATELLPSWDRNADAYQFAPDSTIIIGTSDHGRDKIYRVAVTGGTPSLLVADHNNASFVLSADGHTLVWMRDAVDHPAEVFSAAVNARGIAQVKQVTHVNDTLVSHLKLYPAEDYWFAGAGGDSVHAFLIKPPQWEPGKTYPAVVLIHGGPQAPWLDNWHSRWNYQMFAAPGNAIILINPRGSPGYGQKFTDGVSKDWGDKAYTDIMNGIDAAIVRAPWIDRARLAAAGGSYGGYMVNWIAGHTDRFKALITHAGVFNLENMYGATEELWFPEWEYGAPYWDSTAMATQYRVYSPHLFASHFKTPTLVLHGERDYRVPYTEGLSMFSALQRQGVPSRLVVFPDEGHWIGKPQNQRLWWSEVQGWLAKYLVRGDTHASR